MVSTASALLNLFSGFIVDIIARHGVCNLLKNAACIFRTILRRPTGLNARNVVSGELFVSCIDGLSSGVLGVNSRILCRIPSDGGLIFRRILPT